MGIVRQGNWLTSPFSQSLKSLAGEAVESVRQGLELTVISQQAEVLSDRVSWLPSVYRTTRLPRVMSGSPGCCSSHYLILSCEIHGPWKEHRSWWKGFSSSPRSRGQETILGALTAESQIRRPGCLVGRPKSQSGACTATFMSSHDSQALLPGGRHTYLLMWKH